MGTDKQTDGQTDRPEARREKLKSKVRKSEKSFILRKRRKELARTTVTD